MYSGHAPVTMHHYHYQNWRAASRLLADVLKYDLPSYWSHEFGEAWNMSRHGEDSPDPAELLPDKVDRYRKFIEHLLTTWHPSYSGGVEPCPSCKAEAENIRNDIWVRCEKCDQEGILLKNEDGTYSKLPERPHKDVDMSKDYDRMVDCPQCKGHGWYHKLKPGV